MIYNLISMLMFIFSIVGMMMISISKSYERPKIALIGYNAMIIANIFATVYVVYQGDGIGSKEITAITVLSILSISFIKKTINLKREEYQEKVLEWNESQHNGI